MNHDEVDCTKYKDKWLSYVKQGVLCTAFSYARYSKAMQEITGFGMKDGLSAPGIGWKYFNSLRSEEDEPIYTFKDKYMSWFVRQNVFGGRVCAFNQNYKSKMCVDVLNILSRELKFEGEVYNVFEAYMKHERIFWRFLKKNMTVNLTILEMKMKRRKKFKLKYQFINFYNN